MSEDQQTAGFITVDKNTQSGFSQQLDEIARNGKVQLLFLAVLVCLRVWEEVFVVGSFAPDAFREANGFLLHQMFYGAKAVGFLLVALFGIRLDRLHEKRPVLVAVAAGMLCGSALLMTAWEMQGSSALLAIVTASLLGGVSAALALVIWFEICRSLSPIMVLMCYTVGSLIFPFVMVGVYSLPFVAAMALGLVMPILVMVLLHVGFATAPKPQPTTKELKKSGGLLRLLVLLGALSFALGIWEPGQSNELFGSGSLASLGSIAVYLLVIVGFALKGSQFKLVPIFRVLLPITAVAFMLLPTDTPVMAAASDLCSSASYHLAVLLGILVCMNLCYRGEASPARVFGLLYGVLNATVVLGFFAWYLLKASGMNPVLAGNATSLIIAAVIALMFLLLPEKDELVSWGISGAGKTEELQEEDLMERRIHSLGKRFGLTIREEEVALLLAQGMTGTQIEEQLFIAKGTLKTHRRNIYAKCNVHSQAELAALIEGE